MRIVSLPEIRAALDEPLALAAVEQSFRDLSAGRAQMTAVGYLGLPLGHCHVKGAAVSGNEVFAVKLIASFAGNATAGKPLDHGFIALFSTATGEMLALLEDDGF